MIIGYIFIVYDQLYMGYDQNLQKWWVVFERPFFSPDEAETFKTILKVHENIL